MEHNCQLVYIVPTKQFCASHNRDSHNPQGAFGPQGSAQTSVTGDTHADLPSTSSLPGWTPFFARMEATFSTSPLSAAFINRSSYLFHSTECYKRRRRKETAWHVSQLSLRRKQQALQRASLGSQLYPNSFLSAILTWPGQQIIYLCI